jgi:hypothetical protein
LEIRGYGVTELRENLVNALNNVLIKQMKRLRIPNRYELDGHDRSSKTRTRWNLAPHDTILSFR